MIFSEQDIKIIEAVTLDGKCFNDNQKEFINLFETKYIIAGPGVGKTTCLSAKIVLMLMKMANENSRDAICIITHTNVAVDEINRILNRMGISKIKHPHFVGTIHQFFNTYLALPYIKKKLNPKNIRFSKEEDYSSILSFLVNKSSYFSNWATAALIKIKASKLVYDKQLGQITLENTSNWDKFDKHKSKMLNLKLDLKKRGYFSFEDTFLFAQAAIENDNNIRILRKRFKYVFIDEFQDTNPQSIDIIKKIFMKKGNVLQFIGDPNQTLDFDGEKPEVDPGITFELKVCNRFGANIARHLPIIINGVNIQSLNEIVSFDPLMIIYKENKELIPFYKEILMECNYNKDFAKSKRKDSILSIRKDTIQQLEFGRNTQNITGYIPKSTEAYTQHLLKLINELIYKKISSLKSIDFDLKNWIKEHPNQMDIKKTLISDIKLKKLNVSTLRNIINLILNEQISNSINSTNEIFHKIENIINVMNGKNNDKLQSEKETNGNLVFGTIHSAKGETHRSVLLIDSEKSKMIHTNMLKSFYCNNDINYDDKWVEKNLLYVAMSRPTHLFAFGMKESQISSENIQMFKDKGWDIRYTNSH
ncbi:UvrD-helicase domain-containing protein [Paenibacillus peoriae]|uniref:UvrD-helicase domain-containing protein n=1 Tax=Paenibacillus TaxID=44249 RepID=UPI0007AB94D0|nr:UvrD-helicase domain-containing protein [Paenibacillus jamilae]KZE65710.1 hypothetical protein AV545_24105 [Paenibacillus jamilae]